MSRSRRKTPKMGRTTAVSEKADKVAAHRRARRATKVATDVVARECEDVPVLEVDHPRTGDWEFAKDGKPWFGPGARWRLGIYGVAKRKSLLRK
jgi:hypothetical protein